MQSLRRPLLAVLALAGATACGGGSGPTDPGPTLIPLILDFTYVEVIEDCDGVEGDGEFHFTVTVDPPGIGPSDIVYLDSPTLGPGGKSPLLGRRTYMVDPSTDVSVLVGFRASEVDRSIFGAVYNDERLDDQYQYITHVHLASGGGWTNLGPQQITLGSQGCRVSLSWTARDG